MKPLRRDDSSISSITLSWEEPEDDGGCPIESYAIFRNDGEGGAIDIEVNTDNDSNIRNKPTLRQMTVTNFPAEALGKTFFYQIEAFNVVRSSKSFTASYLMAAVAPAPLVGPSDVVLVTDETQIMVTYPELESATERGGTTILSYNLQMDDGAGTFHDIHGFDSDVLDLFALVEADEGVTYSFRYRAKNLYGWSAFSPVTKVLAAGLPSAPSKPSFISATDNSISLQLYPSYDSLGAAITHYVLEVDEGGFNTAFSDVGSYD